MIKRKVEREKLCGADCTTLSSEFTRSSEYISVHFCIYSIRFIYKEDAVIRASNAVQTLYAAKKYLVPGLVSKCSQFLERSIHLDNALTLLEQGLAVDEQVGYIVHWC